MKNTNMREDIHTNNKEITPLLSRAGENCKNIMLRKVIQNSFSTFTKILRQLNEKCLPYYLCGGTGSLEELYSMGLSKTILGGPYAVCPKCREVTSEHDLRLVINKQAVCKKCGCTLAFDGADTDSVYFWKYVNSDVHFEVCVNDEGFKLAHDYIESLIQSLQLSSDELVITDSPTECVLVYRRITVKCDGTVPDRHYRVPQFTITRVELYDFVTADLRSKKSILAPDYAGLIKKFPMCGFQIIALQRGTFATGADGVTPYEFFKKLPKSKYMDNFPLTPESLYTTIEISSWYGEDINTERYEWFMSSPHPIYMYDIINKFEGNKSHIEDDEIYIWLSRIISMKSSYENMDFAAMHYLLSL